MSGGAGAPPRGPRHPTRIVHLGLGAFHRAHQAWYTQLANDDTDGTDGEGDGTGWGIAAFTGRRPDAAEALRRQDDRYTLITRGPAGDDGRLIESISHAEDGADRQSWRAAVADSAVAIVTLTVTEAGYRLDSRGRLDPDDPVIATDLRLLAGSPRGTERAAASSAVGRLVDGLAARRAAGGGPLAIVSCDNLPANGEATRRSVVGFAAALDPELASWIEAQVSFVSTMVDRITPASTDDNRLIARELTGLDDHSPVVTEPFSEWVLSGSFPAGRPAWHRHGAQFVDDVEPFEQRKLWLLNGGHSLLAYLGLSRGLRTVTEAFDDPGCREPLERLWADSREVLAVDAGQVDAWLDAVRARWTNPRLEHSLAQIAADGSQKLGPRLLDVQRRRLAAGLPVSEAAATVLAAWIDHLLAGRATGSAADPRADSLARALADAAARERPGLMLAALAPDLAANSAGVELEQAVLGAQAATRSTL